MTSTAWSALRGGCFGERRGDVVVIEYDTRPWTL
jgi:hypothetical protein